MYITRELAQMESLRMGLIAEFRAAFEQRGLDVNPYSDELISDAVRRSAGASDRHPLRRIFDLLMQQQQVEGCASPGTGVPKRR
jgi:hypothetical protein